MAMMVTHCEYPNGIAVRYWRVDHQRSGRAARVNIIEQTAGAL